jgi:hypothetical protein
MGHHFEELITKFDAQVAAFRPALALTDDYLKSHQHEGPIYIFNSTKATVSKYADTRPGPDQPTQLDITWYTELILRAHADISLRISWFKHEDAREAYQNIKKIAFQGEETRKRRTRTSQRTSLAYRTACTKPPDGKLHPKLRIQQKGWLDKPFRSK